MSLYEFTAPCHFGMEAVLKREIINLGYDIVRVEDGRVTFRGEASAIARANAFLRTAERVLLSVARFKAYTFDELFERTKALPWADYLPVDGKFWVKKASTTKSKLFSSSDIQSIVKKAIVEKLKQSYHVDWFKEDGAAYPLRVFIFKDEVTIALDTSGESLHKRGYRKLISKAPVSETLAAAILLLSPWNKDRILVDPFCGSGTFPIEAAMIGANIAPGMNREFTAEAWTNILPKKAWYEAITEANDAIRDDVELDIQGYDIDGEVIKSARQNAIDAGVDHLIHLQQRPVSALSHPKKYGFVITNPPYGERLEEREALPALYKELGDAYSRLDAWSCFVLTSYDQAEKYIGRKADKNRKIYNGMIKTYLYEFMGPRPPKRKKQED
ncbi:MAG: class I SAM-dependent RNA methyltransferase [Clostridia bacterium]|nr:class I SAM-dependent RNA methyltransferase [Lachnospiraceae bacterium]NCC00044.1 class I SAM-dependent RNA methyltransferase [Clostridia bacterium]NCD01888.1 class I SAM-dependent RNA methyltransferase [Clostridia bacterium]